MSNTREFYETDEREGIIVNKSLTNRVFLLELDPRTSLVEQLSRIFGSGARAISLDIRKSYELSAAADFCEFAVKLGQF